MPGMRWKAIGATAAAMVAGFTLSGTIAQARQPIEVIPGKMTLDRIPLVTAVSGDRSALDVQEAADAKVVLAAHKAMLKKRGVGLEPFMPKLQAILARAPSVYPLIEKREDGVVVTRFSDYTSLGLLMLATEKDKLDVRPNTYVEAALMLGWYAIEMGRPADALEPLNKGLALQPAHQGLTSEVNIAQIALKQLPEALAANDLAIAYPYKDKDHYPMLLRSRAYILGELGRYDEAIASLETLLKVVPGDTYAVQNLKVWRAERDKR